MEIKNAITSLGFDDKQSAVYTALLSLGETAMTELARKAGLKRPTTYLIVEQLGFMGLVSETKKGKRKKYSAVHPHRLLEIARFRAKRVEEVLPVLVALYNAPKEKPKIQVFEGIEGIRLLYRELYEALSDQEEALWFTRIDILREYVPEALSEYKKMLRRLSNPRIRELNYGDEEGRRWAQELRRLRSNRHKIRLLPPDYPFGHTDNLIFSNKLVIFSLRREAPFVVVIESNDVVTTYRALFEWAWKQGREES